MDYGLQKEKKKNFKIANHCRYCKKGSYIIRKCKSHFLMEGPETTLERSSHVLWEVMTLLHE